MTWGYIKEAFKLFFYSDRQSSSNMKIDTLAFVQHLLASQHPPAVFHPHAPGKPHKFTATGL
jgi:hypothetical protein